MKTKKSLLISFLLFSQLFCLAQGKFKWLKSPISMGNETAHTVYEDRFGFVYTAGSFSDTLTFANQTHIATGNEGVIFKYDSLGNEIWARRISSSNMGANNYCVGIEGDSIGNIYVLGGFTSSTQFGPFVLNAVVSVDGFLCKLDSGGNFLWVFQMGGGAFDYPRDLKVDAAGNTYITGSYSYYLNFGNIYLNGYLDSEIFVGKVNSSGQPQWVKRAGCHGSGNTHDYGFGIDIDSKGNSYIIGAFRQTADFGPYTLTSAGEEDIFVAKYDSIGNIIWAKRAGKSNSNGDWGSAITLKNDTSIYIIGIANNGSDFGNLTFQTPYNWTTFIAEIDSSGNFKRVKGVSNTTTPGWQIGRGKRLFVNQSGEAYLVVDAQGTAVIGSYTIWNYAIVKLDSVFNVVWVKPLLSISGIYYNQKSVFYCGDFLGTYSIDQYNFISNGIDILTGKINDATNRITGRVFHDIDGDTIYTMGDIPIFMDSIKLLPFNLYLVSDSSGLWQATIDTGIFALNNIIPVGYSQIQPLPNNYTLNLPLTNQTLTDLDFVLVIQTGILENQNENNFQIYPNPFSNSILIRGTKEKGEIILIDFMGKEILRQKLSVGETKINTEKLSSGFYVLQYSDGKMKANFKLTKR